MKFTEKQIRELTDEQLACIYDALETHIDAVREEPTEFEYSAENAFDLKRQLYIEIIRRDGD